MLAVILFSNGQFIPSKLEIIKDRANGNNDKIIQIIFQIETYSTLLNLRAFLFSFEENVFQELKELE